MSRKHSTAVGFGTAMAGAAVAAFLSMGTAHADDSLVPDGYQDLFGAPGTAGLSAGQAADNVSLDEQAALNNLGSAGAFDAAVDRFEEAGTAHPLTEAIFALDQSAFVVQYDSDIDGYLPTSIAPEVAGLHGYLVPDDFLGYLAVDLDAYLLNPTGLGPALLGPLIDVLLGFPASP
jgi:hypothetical protein